MTESRVGACAGRNQAVHTVGLVLRVPVQVEPGTTKNGVNNVE